MTDMVNNPPHYQADGGLESINVMEAVFGTEAVINFCHLNAFKYCWRAGKKGAEAEDLKKAIWYLQKEVELLEELQ